ncbi:purine nucleoside phosphorylase [Prosthecomicrobium hirschii]|uniref:Purine nucleoside phosphorylase n=1 Tax=Prosthecodimorpha hirschii TaxID=665126 RepID=A0A0P6VMT7_9HYPH|nr:purine-nucleoside phosphorylase [Prosthecomicrobium hirschii]KPL54083.1 purine nucleoside phosphorylase [Prosthecomicrobium hirschii]
MTPHELAAVIRDWAPAAPAPKVAIVLGSGLSGLADAVADAARIAYADLPGFPRTGVSGHSGALVLGRLAGVPVAVMAGRAHYYESGRADVMEPAIATLKALGADTLILTNAAGSLDEAMPPGTPMLIADHIALGPNPLIGREGDARFVNMVDAWDPELRALAHARAKALDIPLGEGVYLWFTGPSFETPAEIRMARRLGADAVGMSTVPEAILARYHGLRLLGLSMITNLGAGMTGRPLSHEETKAEAARGADRFRTLLLAILADLAGPTGGA